MPQDQLFKELLHAFLREFLELFYPAVAARLDFGRLTFLDKEAFTDVPEGSRREADLVAQVYTHGGEPEILLVHVEVQTQRRSAFPYRMFEYYALLRFRHRVPVYPLAVYLAPGAGGMVEEAYREALFDQEILTFRYQALGLPDLPSGDYEARPNNPLSAALSTLMRPGGTGRVLRKALALRQVEQSGLDDARRFLLVNVIDTYLPLDMEEQRELRRFFTTQPDFQEVSQVLNSFERYGMLMGKQDTLLRLARRKFGDLPPVLVARIEAITNDAELDPLLDRVLTAAVPDDLLPDDKPANSGAPTNER